jgi:hypothetical protein
MLDGEGLHPSSRGVRVKFSGTTRNVIDGPFTEAKELVAGYWLWQVKSLDEAIEWAKRCPNPMATESEIEIRQVFESEDSVESSLPRRASSRSDCAPDWPPGDPDTADRRRDTMRFFMYTLGDENVPLPPPTPELMTEMGAFMEEATRSGALVATGGFAPSALGAKVALDDGTFTLTDGPFSEAKELIGGWALVETASRDEAIDDAKRFLKIVGGGESRIRRVFGPEDGAPT